MGRYYGELDKAIKEANPNCRIYAWTDGFMPPWQNAPRSKLGDVAKMMPRDAIMGTWYDGPGGTVDFNIKTARLWAGLSHDFTLMGCDDYANIRETAAVAPWARKRACPVSAPAVGVIRRAWRTGIPLISWTKPRAVRGGCRGPARSDTWMWTRLCASPGSDRQVVWFVRGIRAPGTQLRGGFLPPIGKPRAFGLRARMPGEVGQGQESPLTVG